MKSIVMFPFLLTLCMHNQCWSHSNEDKTEPSSIYNMSLENLVNFGTYNTQELLYSPSLWVLFQPECKSCESQFRKLECLPNNIQQIAVGFWGSRENLNKTMRFTQFKGKKLMASTEMEKRIRLKLTPTLLIVDSLGIIHNKIYALTECEQLKTYFKFNEKTKKGE